MNILTNSISPFPKATIPNDGALYASTIGENSSISQIKMKDFIGSWYALKWIHHA